VDALFGDEVFVAEEPKHLVTEHELGLVGIDVRDGMPRTLVENKPAGDDGVNVRISCEAINYVK